MNIHFIIPGDINTLTGGYIYNLNIINGLKAKGHRVSIHDPGNDFPFPSEASLDNFKKILNSIPVEEPVIIDSLVLGPSAALLPVNVHGHRLIALMHLPLFMNPIFTEKEKYEFRHLETIALQRMDKVITVSRNIKRIIQTCQVENSDIQVIYPQAESSQHKVNYPVIPKNLLCIANYTRNKGHIFLFDTLKELTDYNWSLTCYGNTLMDRANLKVLVKFIRDNDLQNRIYLKDAVNHRDLTEIYLKSDLFVLPSLYESYSMVLLESLVHGVPVIANETGGISEVVRHNAGILVDPSDSKGLKNAIVTLFEKPKVYTDLCQAASSFHTSAGTWQDSINLFEKALGQTMSKGYKEFAG